MSRTRAVFVIFYPAILLYAGLTYFLGELVPLATIVLGFGVLIIPYLMLEWIATPVVAAVVGFQSRWSLLSAVAFGLPLVVLFTVVTPVVSSGNSSLPVPVPWLSVFAASEAQVVPVILERLKWWLSLYLLALLFGLLSRLVKPTSANDGG